jgi:hypothetical protein
VGRGVVGRRHGHGNAIGPRSHTIQRSMRTRWLGRMQGGGTATSGPLPSGGGGWRLFAVVVTAALLPAVAAKVRTPPPHTRTPTCSLSLSPPLSPLPPAGAVQHVQIVIGFLVLCAGADCILFWELYVSLVDGCELPACLSVYALWLQHADGCNP